MMVIASSRISPPLTGASLQTFVPFQGSRHRLSTPPPIAQHRRSTPPHIALHKFKVSGQWAKDKESSLMDYLTWFDNRRGSPLPPDLRDEWQQTSWILSNTNYGRNIDLHAIANDQVYQGSTFCCKDLNAYGHYDIKLVTGLDLRVIEQLVRAEGVPEEDPRHSYCGGDFQHGMHLPEV